LAQTTQRKPCSFSDYEVFIMLIFVVEPSKYYLQIFNTHYKALHALGAVPVSF